MIKRHRVSAKHCWNPADSARWTQGDAAELRQISDRYSANVALDGADDPVYLAPNNVYLNMVKEKYPNLRFMEAREVI